LALHKDYVLITYFIFFLLKGWRFWISSTPTWWSTSNYFGASPSKYSKFV